MNKISATFLVLILLVLGSCKKDKPPTKEQQVTSFSSGVLILNEGNYSWGNASVSYFDYKSNTVIDDVFKNANNFPLGDVAQSITTINGQYFVVVNNSKKIEVVDPLTLKKKFTLNGFKSPRYCLQAAINKLYVSDLYDNAIAVVNLISGEIIAKIPCKGWAEQMLLYKNKVFVTNLYSSYLSVVDVSTDKIQDSINIGYASNSICLDSNNKVWLACSGNASLNIKPCVQKINPETNAIEHTFSLTNAGTSICTNFTKDTIYFLSKGVYQVEKNATSISTTPLINTSNANYYAIGIMPLTGNIFVSDALDYVQRGKIIRYSNKGEKISEFTAGIIPNAFVFR